MMKIPKQTAKWCCKKSALKGDRTYKNYWKIRWKERQKLIRHRDERGGNKYSRERERERERTAVGGAWENVGIETESKQLSKK
jgi:hypothetical protein